MHKSLWLLIFCLIAAAPAQAQSFLLTTDNPTNLSGTPKVPWEILRNDSGSYSVQLTLGDKAEVDALYLDGDGTWYLSVATPTLLGGAFYEPRDVIKFDGVTFGKAIDGAAEGIPANVSIDALYYQAGDFFLSFDIPVSLFGVKFVPADVIKWVAGGGSTFVFDSATNGIATSSNVVAADERNGRLYLTFDVATSTPWGRFLNGEIAVWNGATLNSFYLDAVWPRRSFTNGFSLLPRPGEADDLLLDKAAGVLNLSWSGGCSPAGADTYVIYRGTIGSWYDHTQFVCSDSTGGPLDEDVAIGGGSYYYLVVSENSNDEGSYGRDSSGSERPMALGTCGAVSQDFTCP